MVKESKPNASALSRREFLTRAPGGLVAGQDLAEKIHWELSAALLNWRLPLTQGVPRLFLSGISWVDEGVPGVRLRWIFPLHAGNSTDYLGFPNSVLVQKATIDQFGPFPEHGSIQTGVEPIVGYPREWWNQGLDLRSIAPAVFQPHGTSSVQAVTFVFSGPDSRCRFEDSQHCTLAEFEVRNSQRVYYEAGEIAYVVFASDNVHQITLSQAWTLDLYQQRKLHWQDVATIAVRQPLVDQAIGDFSFVQSRLRGHATLGQSDWATIQDQAMKADRIKKPSDDNDPNLKMSAWDGWLALQTFRWEVSVLAGFGFVDGPKPKSPLKGVEGDVVSSWLDTPSPHPTVYKLVVPDPPDPIAAESNLVIVPSGKAAPLKRPIATYKDLTARPIAVAIDFDPAQPVKAKSVFVGHANLSWQHQNDPWAMGIEVTEKIGDSPTKPNQRPSPLTERLIARKKRSQSFWQPRKNVRIGTSGLPFRSDSPNIRWLGSSFRG